MTAMIMTGSVEPGRRPPRWLSRRQAAGGPSGPRGYHTLLVRPAPSGGQDNPLLVAVVAKVVAVV